MFFRLLWTYLKAKFFALHQKLNSSKSGKLNSNQIE